MPPRNERVVAMVRSELAKNPSVGNDVLLQKAVEIDRGVRRLSPRQFHATYRLPIVRGANAGAKPAAKSAAKAGAPAKSAGGSSAAPPSAGSAGSATSAAPPERPASAAPPERSAGAVKTAPAGATKTAKTASKRGAAGGGTSTAGRESVRRMLNDLIHEALAAEDRASISRLYGSLDERVDAILGTSGRA